MFPVKFYLVCAKFQLEVFDCIETLVLFSNAPNETHCVYFLIFCCGFVKISITHTCRRCHFPIIGGNHAIFP